MNHDELDKEIIEIQRMIPNMSHPDAPVGVDDKANLELRKGKHEPRKFDFEVRTTSTWETRWT